MGSFEEDLRALVDDYDSSDPDMVKKALVDLVVLNTSIYRTLVDISSKLEVIAADPSGRGGSDMAALGGLFSAFAGAAAPSGESGGVIDMEPVICEDGERVK